MARVRGPNLLEALILLLAALAVAAALLPEYRSWQRADYRLRAAVALTALAEALHARHARTGTYAGAALADGAPADTGPPALRPATVPAEGAARYRLRIETANARGFEIHAIPVADQQADPCGTLTLTAAGIRGIEAAAPETRIAACWSGVDGA